MLDKKKTCTSFAQKRMAGDKNMLVKTGLLDVQLGFTLLDICCTCVSKQ